MLSHGQVRIFLQWLRYVIEEVLWERPHVIVNVDETSLHTVHHDGCGLASRSQRRSTRTRKRPLDVNDRFYTKVTYVVVVCDAPALQPLLPQVILPRYSQNQRPPAHIMVALEQQGFPFEFWHGTRGVMTPTIVKAWATGLRRVINSFNEDAWTLLLMDCDSRHLCIDTVTHFRRLGFLVVPVPARLTWLLQVLDVYVFAELKQQIRMQEARLRLSSRTGQLHALDRMKIACRSIRKCIVNTDWAESFSKLGCGSDGRPTASGLQQYMSEEAMQPRLPSLEEFAEIVARPAHTQLTRRLYHMILQSTLNVGRSPQDAHPPRAAPLLLPDSYVAQPRGKNAAVRNDLADDILDEFLEENDGVSLMLTAPQDGRNFFPLRRSDA